jgi:hypothetical protein
MKMVLFDLGRTLEDDGVLLPGAMETLQGIADIRAGGRPAVLLGLLSDFTMPDDPADVPSIRQEYYALLDDLGIRRFFEPLDRRVTLSTEVGVRKPAAAMFRAAVSRVEPALALEDVLFVTEDAEHVRAARLLGLQAARVSTPGRTDGEVRDLRDLLPMVLDLVGDGAEQRRAEDSDAEPATGTWTLLGDDLVVSGGALRGAPEAVARAAPVGAPRVRRVPAGERLQLVTQNGGLFQADHPDVPVLVNKGRYLVVDLEPARAEELSAAGGACWSIRPLPGDAVVLAVRPALGERPEAAAWIRGCVDALSMEGFAADLATLATHRTRHSASTEFDAAAEWAGARLKEAGCTVTSQAVPAALGRCRNVVGDRPGGGPAPRDLVVVTAHLDSINRRGPDIPAPGADDNASGSAGLLAIAHALALHTPALDIRFVLFGGEEQGLFGSRRFVNHLPAPERARIRAVVNMDMIGVRSTAARGVLLEGAAVSADVINALARAAADHTGLTVAVSYSPYNSDHVPFIEVGIPAVLTIEASDEANTAVHTENDTLAIVDPELALEILRMNVAFVAESVGREP